MTGQHSLISVQQTTSREMCGLPTSLPTGQPSAVPTCEPSSQPTSVPTGQPSTTPTCEPSSQPTSVPTGQPSTVPTCEPSSQPTSLPTNQPSSKPSLQVLTAVPIATATHQSPIYPTSLPSSQPPSQTPSLTGQTLRPTLSPSQATQSFVPSKAFSQPVVDASTLLTILQQEQLGDSSDVLYEVITHLIIMHYFTILIHQASIILFSGRVHPRKTSLRWVQAMEHRYEEQLGSQSDITEGHQHFVDHLRCHRSVEHSVKLRQCYGSHGHNCLNLGGHKLTLLHHLCGPRHVS